jgi:hypothetical protein
MPFQIGFWSKYLLPMVKYVQYDQGDNKRDSYQIS